MTMRKVYYYDIDKNKWFELKLPENCLPVLSFELTTGKRIEVDIRESEALEIRGDGYLTIYPHSANTLGLGCDRR